MNLLLHGARKFSVLWSVDGGLHNGISYLRTGSTNSNNSSQFKFLYKWYEQGEHCMYVHVLYVL